MNRRRFLTTAAATAASRGLLAIPPPSHDERRTLFAISEMPRNGGIRLLRHFVSLTGRARPKFLLVPTGLGDDPRWIDFWAKQLAPQLDCDLEALRLFGDSSNMKAHDARILAADAIFVTGGNTLNALAVWRAQGIEASLRRAWERGTVLGGESAGMICWFEQGLSDSRPEKLSVVEGLGWLAGSACPHFDRPERRSRLRELLSQGEIKDGVAADSGTALLYRGTQLQQAFGIDTGGRVFRVRRGTNGVDETEVFTTTVP